MILIIPKSKLINQTIQELNDFLKTLNLKLNPCKTKHNVLECGVNLSGYIIKPFSLYIRNSTKYRAKKATENKA